MKTQEFGLKEQWIVLLHKPATLQYQSTIAAV